MSNLRTNTEVERKRQYLLQQLAELESFQPSASPSTASQHHHRSPIQKQQHRRDVPRSMSSSGTTMARHPSSDRFDNMQRLRNLSQRSAPGASMARVNSKGTSSSRSGNLPFTNNGNIPPPVFESRREQADVDSWVEQPFNAYTFHHQQQRAMSQRSPVLEQVPEQQQLGNVLEDPADFLNRHGALSVSITPAPMSMPADRMNHRNSINSHQFGIQTPTTPAESLTTATTLASEMSRQNSLCNEPFIQSVEMMKFDSNNSFPTENMLDENQAALYTSYPSCRSSKEDQSQIIFGAGGASHDSQFSHSFSTAEGLSQFPSDYLVEKMERSVSNESSSSTSSSASRNKARLQAQNQHAAKRQLAPKGGSDEGTMSRENSSQSTTQSKNGSQDKVAISKPSYVRPKHDRVMCHQCDEQPDGFRGEHELRRHQDRVHKPMVKKWVCIEPAGQGHPKPVLPLSRCKTCTHAKKKYGAYYNAAAHLRRAHFKPKAKGRSKTNKAEKEQEKRGGKAGGDWPPMSELKHWMKEVDEPAPDYSHPSQQDEDESEDESIEENNGSVGNFDFFPESGLVNVYPSPSTQLYAMQDMTLDSQQSIDMSMQYQSSSQNSGFDSFPQTLLSNEASAPFMYDHSSFLDQPVGLDFVQLNSNFSF